ncbi:MAG: hypothetical protein HFE86_05055 [Clostridiales bacterium]|nr:hypothetical protein [Clostridiales bacterium]
MDDKLRILKMVEEGTVTAEQAAELLAALGTELPAERSEPDRSGYDKKLFRVLVESVEGDTVKIQFSVGAVKKILRATGRLPIPEKELRGLDLSDVVDAVAESLDSEIDGEFVNVEGADGSVVQIYVDK